MSYCGNCGHKNPEGATFCSACGAKLRVVETPRPNVESAPQPRYDRPQPPRPSANRGFEKPVKKGGTMGGCLKKLLLWIVIIIVVVVGAFYFIDTYADGTEGNGGRGEEVGQNPSRSEHVEKARKGLLEKDYKRSFNRESFAQLREYHGFPASSKDVSLQPGTYTGRIEEGGETATITLKIKDANEDNKKIVGTAEMIGESQGETRRVSFFLTYAGNSVYAAYPVEEYIGDIPGAMALYVSPDGKTIKAYDSGDVLFTVTKD